MNPWVPMKDAVDIKVLGKLAEELGELTAAVSRCVIQGIDQTEPTTGKANREWLTEEIADVLASLSLAVERFELDEAKIGRRLLRKEAGLRAWHGMAA